MQINLTQNPGSAKIIIQGQVDERGAEALKDNIQKLKIDQIQELVFDFQGVERIGSAGIGQLLLAYKNLAVSGGVMRVEGVSPALLELFKNLKLDTLFTISA